MKKKNDILLKDALKLMVKKNQWKQKLDRVRVEEIWKKIMGKTINKYTKHVTLRNKTLVILIESAPLKQELFYGKQTIIQRMNKEIGEQLIEDVIIH